ncbi:hypothetical protein JCM10135_07250 [Stetteria hydrogenophila]
MLRALTALLVLQALLAASGGSVTLPAGLVHVEDAGVRLNLTGGEYFVKAWRDGLQLAVLSKPMPLHAAVRVEGTLVNVSMPVGGCRVAWLDQPRGGGLLAVNSTGSATWILLDARGWSGLVLHCRGEVEVALVAGPAPAVERAESTITVLSPSELAGNQDLRAPQQGGLEGAALLAAAASLVVSVVAWVAERRVGGSVQGSP